MWVPMATLASSTRHLGDACSLDTAGAMPPTAAQHVG
jgi:hypothetical protein